MQQAVLDLVHGPPALVSLMFQTTPDQHRTRDVVALDAPRATLATLDPRQPPSFPLRLLDLPTHAARLSRLMHRIPSKKLIHNDLFRVSRMHHYQVQLQLVLLGEALGLISLPLSSFSDFNTIRYPLETALASRAVYLAVALERGAIRLGHSFNQEYQVLYGVLGGH